MDASGEVSTDAALDALESTFNISALNLLPLALLVVFTVKKVPPFLAILGSALFAGSSPASRSGRRSKAFVDEPDLGPIATGIKAIYDAMANGFVSNSGNPPIDELFSRGGMSSLLTTVWLSSPRCVRRDPGARRLPRAAASADRGARENARAV